MVSKIRGIGTLLSVGETGLAVIGERVAWKEEVKKEGSTEVAIPSRAVKEQMVNSRR